MLNNTLPQSDNAWISKREKVIKTRKFALFSYYVGSVIIGSLFLVVIFLFAFKREAMKTSIVMNIWEILFLVLGLAVALLVCNIILTRSANKVEYRYKEIINKLNKEYRENREKDSPKKGQVD